MVFFPQHFLGSAIYRSKVKLLEVNPQVVVTSVQQAQGVGNWGLFFRGQ